ncbi:MAG: hypothetical protein LBT33_00670 [Spirochaetia bacterium]|jgi:hypothetical protein|nr:hypothetical protein [Spirochaetia bacterium]
MPEAEETPAKLPDGKGKTPEEPEAEEAEKPVAEKPRETGAGEAEKPEADDIEKPGQEPPEAAEEPVEELEEVLEPAGEEIPEKPKPGSASGEWQSSPAFSPGSRPPRRQPAVIPPEDVMGSEEEIQSMLEQIDAEELPPPPKPAPEPEYAPKTQEEGPSRKAAAPARKPRPEDGIKLLDYLKSLVASLPQERRSSFASSDYPLKIEAVKNMLLGKQGLHREFPEKARDQKPAGEKAVTLDKVKKSFNFVSGLAEYLPNQDVKTVLQEKLKSIEMKLGDKHQ